MSTQKRQPTQSTVKVDPSIEIHKTLYPYLNFKQTGLTSYIDSFKRTIGEFNPLALPQVATSEREAIGMRSGSGYYFQDMYPNSIHFDQAGPSHYDPFSDTRRGFKYGVKQASQRGDKLDIQHEFMPRFCQRTIATYKRCLVANDDSEGRCAHQQQNILSICPNFVLDGLRQKKLRALKIEAMNNKLYRQVMQVPSYNQGRTIAHTARKSWNDGTGDKLRSDSMWTDDRYVDINQEEIDQAKARIQQRNQARGHVKDQSVHLDMYDRSFQKPSDKTPLYP